VKSNAFSLENRIGEPVKFGDRQMIPISQVLRIQPPMLNLGLVWNRPASIVVRQADGSEQVLPVIDVTRRYQWSIFAAGIVFSAFFWAVGRFVKIIKEKIA